MNTLTSSIIVQCILFSIFKQVFSLYNHGFQEWIPYRGRFYGVSSIQLPYEEAEMLCVEYGGNLTRTLTPNLNQILNQKMVPGEAYWVGATPSPDGVFFWSDGSVVESDYWFVGEPSSVLPTSRAAYAHNGSVFLLESRQEDEINNFICERQSLCLEMNVFGFVKWCIFNGTLYGFSYEKRNFDDASEVCLNNDGSLLSGLYPALDSFLNNHMRDVDQYWVGLKRLGTLYIWPDGTQEETFWGDMQPSLSYTPDGEEFTRAMYDNQVGTPNKALFDTVETASNMYICERPIKPCVLMQDGPIARLCEFAGRNYGFSSTEATFDEAVSLCNSTGGSLLTGMTEGLHPFLTMQIDDDKNYWVNAKRLGNSYYWADMTEVNPDLWDAGQPTDDTARTGAIYSKVTSNINAYMYDESVTNYHYFICEQEIPQQPEEALAAAEVASVNAAMNSPVEVAPCGADTVVLADFEIVEYNMEAYSPNLYCEWRAQAETPGRKMVYMIDKINVGIDDGLSLYDDLTADPNKAVFTDYSGLSTKKGIASTPSGTALVTFSSGNQTNPSETGFRIRFMPAIDQSENDCTQGVHLEAEDYEQCFTSPNFPDFYPKNVSCGWRVFHPDERARIHLNMKLKDLEMFRVPSCTADYLMIYKQNKRDNPEDVLCGENTWNAEEMTIDDNEIFLNFISDSHTAKKGFVMCYWAELPPADGLPATTLVGEQLDRQTQETGNVLANAAQTQPDVPQPISLPTAEEPNPAPRGNRVDNTERQPQESVRRPQVPENDAVSVDASALASNARRTPGRVLEVANNVEVVPIAKDVSPGGGATDNSFRVVLDDMPMNSPIANEFNAENPNTVVEINPEDPNADPNQDPEPVNPRRRNRRRRLRLSATTTPDSRIVNVDNVETQPAEMMPDMEPERAPEMAPEMAPERASERAPDRATERAPERARERAPERVEASRTSSRTVVFDAAAGDGPCPRSTGTYPVAHPTDCRKYIYCVNGAHITRNCKFGLFFDPRKERCAPASEVQCENDPCRDRSLQNYAGGDFNCRHYWECRNRRSVARCCDSGHGFFQSQRGGSCLRDDMCEDSCRLPDAAPVVTDRRRPNESTGQAQAFPVPSTGAASGPRETISARRQDDCPLRNVDPRGSRFFHVSAPGVIQSCPVGTMFSASACNCISVEDAPVCNREVFLNNFIDYNVTGITNRASSITVLNENVKFAYSYGLFLANSSVYIPHYAGNDNLQKQFGIQLRVFLLGNSVAKATGRNRQVLISNCVPGEPDKTTMEVVLDLPSKTVEFAVTDVGDQVQRLQLPIQTRMWTNIVFIVGKANVKAVTQKVNNRNKKLEEVVDMKPFRKLKMNFGPLRIGAGCENRDGIMAFVDEVAVTFCSPEPAP